MNPYTYMDPAAATAVNSAAITAAIVGAIIGVLIAYIIVVIPMWRIYEKAGEKGWKALVPFYNGYIQFKIAWNTKMFFVQLLLSIVYTCFYAKFILDALAGIDSAAIVSFLMFISGAALFVISIMLYHKFSKAFGHGVGFTLGLIFLSVIFLYILAFGSSEYKGPQK